MQIRGRPAVNDIVNVFFARHTPEFRSMHFLVSPFTNVVGISYVSFMECRLLPLEPTYRYKSLALNISKI